MNLPSPEVCNRIRELHGQLCASDGETRRVELLELLTANNLSQNDLPEFFAVTGAGTSKQLPEEKIRQRIAKFHSQISASDKVWALARRKLIGLLVEEGYSWTTDLPAIVAADWIAKNPSSSCCCATASPSATPVVNVFALNRAVVEDRVVMSPEEVIVVALWALNSYSFRRYEYVPHLGLISPSSGCGKSITLRTLKGTVAHPWHPYHVTAPSIYRRLRRQSHTYLLDEAENQGLLQDRKLRAILDAAFERDGCVDLVEDGEAISIPVFAPFAWAIRGETRDVPLSVLSRSLVVHMKVGEPRKRLVINDPELLDTHAENMKWAASAQLDFNPPIPEELCRDPRVADLCRPLLAIADNLGHGAEARAALIKICGERPNQDVGIQMLLDCGAVWQALDVDRIAKKELHRAIVEMAPERWADWRGPNDRGQPHALTTGELSRLLRRFGIGPHTVWPVPRLPTSKSVQGYYRRDFEKAWRDYCDSHTPTQSSRIIALVKHATSTSDAQ
jgi:hypothetical protein